MLRKLFCSCLLLATLACPASSQNIIGSGITGDNGLAPPVGFVFLLGADNDKLLGADGNYLLGTAP